MDGNDSFFSVPPENQNDAGEEETPDEEDPSPPFFGHLSDNVFHENFEIFHKNQHLYNTLSKVKNTSSPEASKNML